MQWVSNAAAPGIPSGALFNPYVQYRVDAPLNQTAPLQIRFTQQDQYGNGNTTTVKEYDWAPASAVQIDQNTDMLTSVCTTGCTLLRETDSVFNGTTAYWNHGTAAYLRAPQTVKVGNGSSTWATTTYTYDDNCGCTTANLLHLDQSDNATNNPAGSIRTSWTYLSNGNVSSMTDPNSNLTQFTYACGPNGDVYPSTVTVAGTLHTSYSYNCNSGFLNSVTDTDNSITTSYTYDETGRTTQTEQKNAGAGLDRSTYVTFDDVNLTVKTKQDDTSAGQLVNTTYFDALGRVNSTVDGLGKPCRRPIATAREAPVTNWSPTHTPAQAISQWDGQSPRGRSACQAACPPRLA
jgi:YD repeat-containing protein